MKRTLLALGVGFLVGCISSAAVAAGPGKWYKNEKHRFRVRVPAKWDEVTLKSESQNLVGYWLGPTTQVNLKKLGTRSFRASSRIIWLDSRSRGAVTKKEEEEKAEPAKPEGKLSEEERKKLLAERRKRVVARDFEQWLNNFSGLTGVRIISKKKTTAAKRPAVEYEFLSKTNLNVDYKHFALSVKVSDFNELVLMYSVLEKEYKGMRSLFKSCAKTLKIDAAESPDRRTEPPETAKEADGEESVPRDLLITEHGRVVQGSIREEGDSYIVELGSESIRVPRSLVKSVEYGNPSPFTPETEEEKRKAAKGYLKYKGRWMLKSSYEAELRRDRLKLEEKIDAMKKHSDPADPWRVKTPRFVLETTTNEDLLEHYKELIEALFKAYDQKMGVNVSSNARKKCPNIRIFKDSREYMNYTKARGTGGYFSWVDNTLYLYHNFEDPPLTERVLLHEGTHLLNFLSNTRFSSRPHWVEEGLAEYFGSSEIVRDKYGKIKLVPGQILGNRLIFVNRKIETDEVKKLRSSLSTDSYKYEDYAYWWTTVHFFMTHPKYDSKFLNYCRNLYALQGVDKRTTGSYYYVSPEASVRFLEKKLKIRNWDALQAEWEDFVKASMAEVGGYGWMVLGRDLYGEYVKEVKKKRKKEEAEEERREKLDKLLEQSVEAFEKAIGDKEYGKAAVFYYRSLAYKEQEAYEKSLLDIQEAVTRDPLNARFYYKRAALLYRKDDKDGAKKDMRIAMALNPLDLMYPLILEEMERGSYVDLSRY